MAREDRVKEYIKKAVSQGFSKESIKKRLIQAGFSSEIADKYINSFIDNKDMSKVSSNIPIQTRNKPSYMKLVGIAILLLVLIFAIWFLKQNLNLGAGNEGLLTVQTPQITFEGQMDLCINNRSTVDYLYCKAFVDNDISICDKISNSSYLRSYCKVNFIYFKAFQSKDKSLCKKFQEVNIEETDYDYSLVCEIIIDKINDGLVRIDECESVESEVDKQICKTFVADDLSYCKKLEGDERVVCESVIVEINAVAKNSPDLCGDAVFENECLYLVTEDEKYCEMVLVDNCKDISLHTIALSRNDINLCENITIPEIEEQCKTDFLNN